MPRPYAVAVDDIYGNIGAELRTDRAALRGAGDDKFSRTSYKGKRDIALGKQAPIHSTLLKGSCMQLNMDKVSSNGCMAREVKLHAANEVRDSNATFTRAARRRQGDRNSKE